MKVEFIRESKVAADVALKNRLYVSGWSLSETLKEVRSGVGSGKVIVATANGTPVGVVCYFPKGSCSVFTRKSFRKKGIAFQLMCEARSDLAKDVYIDEDDINPKIKKSRIALMNKVRKHFGLNI